jgi:hypothetical protein
LLLRPHLLTIACESAGRNAGSRPLLQSAPDGSCKPLSPVEPLAMAKRPRFASGWHPRSSAASRAALARLCGRCNVAEQRLEGGVLLRSLGAGTRARNVAFRFDWTLALSDGVRDTTLV